MAELKIISMDEVQSKEVISKKSITNCSTKLLKDITISRQELTAE